MGRIRDLIRSYRASRSVTAVDPATLGDLAKMTPSSGASAGFDAAEHMQRLAQAGVVVQPTLSGTDPRLEPVDGMTFDVYVKLVVASISQPTDEAGLEARGVEHGMGPGATRGAFEKWGQRIVSDPELGVHYTAVLQAELAGG